MPIRAKGRWIQLAAPLARQYEALSPGEKRPFLRHWSSELGESENGLWRAIAAYRYLTDRGARPLLMAPPPPLIAVEAVQRTGKHDSDLENSLFAELSRGRPVRYFLEQHRRARSAALQQFTAQAQAQARARDPLRDAPLRARRYAWQLPLSELLLTLVDGRPGPFRVIASDQHLYEPDFVLHAGGSTVAIVAAAWRGDPKDPRLFQILVDRLALRALANFDSVVICAEVDLPDLQDSRLAMKSEFSQRLRVVDARLSPDVALTHGEATFADAAALLEHRRLRGK